MTQKSQASEKLPKSERLKRSRLLGSSRPYQLIHKLKEYVKRMEDGAVNSISSRSTIEDTALEDIFLCLDELDAAFEQYNMTV